MAVLVTGAAGFIGAATARALLDRGDDVLGIDNLNDYYYPSLKRARLYRRALTALRFLTVYGPWGRPDMAMWIFVRTLFAGEPLPVFNGGEMRRDFAYIDDIVSGVVACLDSPPADDGATKAGGSSNPH